MKGDDLKNRTLQFGLRILAASRSLPPTVENLSIRRQLTQSGTAVGAHYREACRARSRREFVSKIELALQELEEATYWLELLIRSDTLCDLGDVLVEAGELNAVLTGSVLTTKRMDPVHQNGQSAERRHRPSLIP